MEFEVRLVGGVESCFVSLPLSLIQTLQSTRSGGFLPHLLALELRSRDDSLWRVAWSGSASASPAIEVAQQFAECIGLPDHTTVKVLAIANLPKATQVMIVPDTEDDWEVMELNSEHAEAAILKQVGIVHQAMRFPLWLHGRTVVTFLVVSVFPKKSVVQLVPGTEVTVAPKGRRKIVDDGEDCCTQSSRKALPSMKALLRVQDLRRKFMNRTAIEGIELGIDLTSVAFIHPETAKKYSLDILQLVVIMPRLSSRKSLINGEKNILRKGNSSDQKEINSGILIDQKDSRQTIVRLLLSESVATGHIMLAKSLRLYLKARLCSWIYVKSCNIDVKKDVSSLSLSPCQFKMVEDNYFGNNSLEVVDDYKHYNDNNGPFQAANTNAYLGTVDRSINEEVITAFPYESYESDAYATSDIRKGLQSLLREWCLAQLDAIASYTGVRFNSLILGNETLLHFEVKGYKFRAASSNDSLMHGNGTGGSSVQILYMLTFSGGSTHDGKVNGYELVINDKQKKNEHQGSLDLFGKLYFGEPVIFHSAKHIASNKGRPSIVPSFSWMGTIVSDITNRLTLLLSHVLFQAHNLPLPGHILIYGPPGSGKTTLARAVAKSVEESENLLAHIVFVSCSELALEKAPAIHQALSGFISEAFDHAPSLVIFDDLDTLVSSSSETEGSQPSTSVTKLTQFLADIMDEYAEKRKCTCGIGPIAFLASVQTFESLPLPLSSSGRFDFHVQLSSPAASERFGILKHEIQTRHLSCSDDLLLDIASKCDGYDAYDLVILVDRAVHAAVSRYLPYCQTMPTLVCGDFSQAMHEFLPVAMRDINKTASEGGASGWDTVGGLTDIRSAIKEMIELPSKFPNIFALSPLRLRSNVLLYGPPGCGKTHIVGAAAAACSLRFISVKGPELLNKYIGASEQAVRDIFSKAAAAAPCLLFFDEFDSIAPKRGHDNTGVTDRVVNQFLTELDGVETLTGVFVFAATSRPDLLDAALLRPGRLDRLLFCDFPSQKERLEILMVLSGKLPLAEDVDLGAIAQTTEGFSGADLQALLSDAQLAAVHELLGSADYSDEPGKKQPVITNALLKSIASKARPSVSESEKKRLYGIYSQFLDSKRPVSDQSRDAKGKRATLA